MLETVNKYNSLSLSFQGKIIILGNLYFQMTKATLQKQLARRMCENWIWQEN